MSDLLNEQITGILIQDFLNPTEIASLLNGFRKLPLSEKTVINEGFVSYPLSFAQFTQMKAAGTVTIDGYIEIAQKLKERQTDLFGLNITERLCLFLQMFKEFQHVSPIIHPETAQALVPFNIRELLPGQGELIAHCENLFFEEFPSFFSWLQLMNIKENKLSYFITLQAAEEGGELCCFDLNWNDVKKRENPILLRDELNNAIDLEDKNSVRRTFIKPKAGDLLLFAGGNVWHRVEKIKGTQSRITLGGFVAETTAPGKYYIWS
ncbi:MAG TPA: hypothetical protein VK154_09565 [Chitinophagales bacterium]|nr:hypothetical protein [Chitinophagales bacterium]